MSFTLLGILNAQAAGAAGVVYRLQTLGGSPDDELGQSIRVDSSGDIYALGDTESSGAGGFDALLVKYDKQGVIEWQRTLGGTGNERLKSLALDSASNSYIVGNTNNGTSGFFDLLLAKYDSSGTLQWQRFLGDAPYDEGSGVTVDSSNNIYVCGTTESAGAGSRDFLVAKYDSSGTLQWQRVLGGANSDQGKGISTDSAGNVYVTGFTDPTGEFSYDILIAKYNSSGTLQFQRTLGGAGSDQAQSIQFDSADNFYISAQQSSAGAGSLDMLVAKYSSSGTLQWQRILGGSGADRFPGLAIDSADNIYITGQTNSVAGGGDGSILIAKYDSSGTIQFQRSLTSTEAESSSSIDIDSEDNLYIIGNQGPTGGGDKNLLIAVLPNDGSLTGTYDLNGISMVYAASSLTAATSSLASATSSLSGATSSIASSTGDLTSAIASLTEHRVDLE